MKGHDQKDCVNLWHLFGHEYRVGWDPAYDPEHVPREKLDPWYFEISGARGKVWPYGGEYLAAKVDGRPKTVKEFLATVPGSVLIQDGDREKTIRFHYVWLHRAAELLRLRRKRRLSEKQKKECIERIAKYRFA